MGFNHPKGKNEFLFHLIDPPNYPRKQILEAMRETWSHRILVSKLSQQILIQRSYRKNFSVLEVVIGCEFENNHKHRLLQVEGFKLLTKDFMPLFPSLFPLPKVNTRYGNIWKMELEGYNTSLNKNNSKIKQQRKNIIKFIMWERWCILRNQTMSLGKWWHSDTVAL